jgi:hypothetical protein
MAAYLNHRKSHRDETQPGDIYIYIYIYVPFNFTPPWVMSLLVLSCRFEMIGRILRLAGWNLEVTYPSCLAFV